jgi:glycosyltransferase involved in cell wall biosynthesis
VPERDFLVVPEDIGGEYRTLPCRKVVFNKNIYYGAAALNSDGGFDRYLDGDTVAAFAVSDANSAYLRYAYPRLKIFTLYPEVDSAAFFHQPVSAKKRIIAVGPKGRRDVITLVQLLKARRTQGLNALAGWKCVLLEGLTEAEVAATLADSTVFISLSTAEGLARMPLEAMSAGCLVAAYDVGSAQEYLPPSSRFQVGDFVGIAKWVEAIAAAYGADRPALDDVARPGRALALRYSRQRQVDAVAEAWTEILATGNR